VGVFQSSSLKRGCNVFLVCLVWGMSTDFVHRACFAAVHFSSLLWRIISLLVDELRAIVSFPYV